MESATGEGVITPRKQLAVHIMMVAVGTFAAVGFWMRPQFSEGMGYFILSIIFASAGCWGIWNEWRRGRPRK